MFVLGLLACQLLYHEVAAFVFLSENKCVTVSLTQMAVLDLKQIVSEEVYTCPSLKH